jgi:type IV secretory pathway VirB2 component (pilin)
MFKRKRFHQLLAAVSIMFFKVGYVWAQDVNQAADDFSTKMLTIFKGPLIKIMACVVLFAGVAGLLRGKNQVAVSCGVAFVLLLCLPLILGYFEAH